MYIKKLYADDPLFENTKVIYSVFDNGFEEELSDSIVEKLMFEDLKIEDVEGITKLNIGTINKFASLYADGVIQASENMDDSLLEYIKSLDKPFMSFPGEEDFNDAYLAFYDNFIEETEDVEV